MNRASVVLAIALVSSAAPALANASDVPPSAIQLAITDAANSPLPGVTVSVLTASEESVRDSQKFKTSGRLKIADAGGHVVFESVPSGQYFIRLELVGFLVQTIGPIQVGSHCVKLPELRVVLQSWESTCF